MGGVPAKAALYDDVFIRDVPHVKQKPDFCGEACAEMYLRKLGRKTDQDDVFNSAGLDPMQGRGCHTPDLARALKQIGFETGEVWYKLPVAHLGEEVEKQWKSLHGDLARGIPTIICMRLDDSAGAGEHFRLILGYDRTTDEVIYHEPAEANGSYRRMKRSDFLKLWPLRYWADQSLVIQFRLEAKDLKDPAGRNGFSSADYAQHVMALRKKLPGKQFSMVLERPFVVVGDEEESAVRLRAERIVRWAVEKLKSDYFAKDPEDILDVWLFKDKGSYTQHTRQVFGDKPTTPFGYYSARHRALIMDISTGGGTLVHEIVHPFMETNFPECPAWFNEGLGSLYEQSGERDGHIIGHTNWRLAGLQDAIRGGALPSFQQLTATMQDEFYNEDRGDNYAQARYLCYYLQERGLLVKFYHEFYKGRKEDPTGYKTLQKILGERDMQAFQKKWEAYVLKLRFP